VIRCICSQIKTVIDYGSSIKIELSKKRKGKKERREAPKKKKKEASIPWEASLIEVPRKSRLLHCTSPKARPAYMEISCGVRLEHVHELVRAR